MFKDKASNELLDEIIIESDIVEAAEETLKRKYRLFVPVFIWKYNSLKKHLATVEQKLYALYVAVDADEAFLKDLEPNANDEPAPRTMPRRPLTAAERLEFGTALRFRQGEKWKTFISESQSQTRNRKRPSLGNPDDTSRSTRQAGPSRSIVSQPSAGEGMSFSFRTLRHIS